MAAAYALTHRSAAREAKSAPEHAATDAATSPLETTNDARATNPTKATLADAIVVFALLRIRASVGSGRAVAIRTSRKPSVQERRLPWVVRCRRVKENVR
jgi:hypothetical protein